MESSAMVVVSGRNVEAISHSTCRGAQCDNGNMVWTLKVSDFVREVTYGVKKVTCCVRKA